MSRFKLRCELAGHEKDVRTVFPSHLPPSGIITGSRDRTTRIWLPNETGAGFTEGSLMQGHSGFVSSVCYVPGTDDYPQGLIMTGSADKTIQAYTLDSASPVYTLTGHTDNVCALAAGKFGTLLSGSWDKTAKVWLKTKCLMTLSGHDLAVWAVAFLPECGRMITGSADKTIKVWKAGKCETTLTGHDDCVRGLAVLTSEEFFSCSNDSSIRRWSAVQGTVLQVYFSHTNFVYGIAAIPNTKHDFVSVSEDRTLKIWKNGNCEQTISHPATSVWCVCCLDNGDIVTGSSDGVVRVFTSSIDRVAPEDEVKAFEQQVASSQIPTQIGDINAEKLPGPGVLLAPGKKEGAVQMVKNGQSVEAHQWSAADQRWVKVGDVVGSSGGASHPRTLYEGKEYDYIFSVDIEEGKPPLKLPYNMTEDPYYAAQRFLDKHSLSQLFLDQVATFITENAKSVSMDQVPAGSSFVDPLTGGGRYVPGSDSGMTSGGVGYADPFTGTGRYVPGTGSTTTPRATTVPASGADPLTGGGSYRPMETQMAQRHTNPYFPQQEIVTFNVAKPEAIIKKLKEFNKQLTVDDNMADGDLEALSEVMNIDKTPTAPLLNFLWRVLQWPKDKVFPAIDVMRVSLRNKTVNEYFCNAQEGPAFLQHLAQFLDTGSSPETKMLSLRALANTAAHQDGLSLLEANREYLVPMVAQVTSDSNKNIQIGASTVLLNYAVTLKGSDDIEAKSQLLSAFKTAAEHCNDGEAQYRLCVGIGTLVWEDENSQAMAESLQVRDHVKQWRSQSELEKLADCAKHLGDSL